MPTAIINGLTHYFVDEGAGEPLVLLHGAASSGESLKDNYLALSEEFRVIVPDLRGMGGSAHVKDLPPGGWVDDLFKLLEYLNIPKANFYGTSLGSRIALRFALDHPNHTNFVIMDAPIIANDPSGDESLNRNFDPGTFSSDRKALARSQHGDDWEQVMNNFLLIRNDVDLQEFYNLRDLCQSIGSRVLIMRGDVDDPVHPLSHSFELHAKIGDSTLAIIPACPSGVGRGNPKVMRSLISEFVLGNG